MMKMFLLVFIFIVATTGQHSATIPQTSGNDTTALEQWHAGEIVSSQAVEAFGETRCFAIEPISDAIFSRMKGRSYKQECPVARSELRYLKILHYSTDSLIHLGELVCHKGIARDLTEIFRQLYQAHYPIERIELIDEFNADDELSMEANNSSCFNFRTVAGSKKISAHGRGLAVDINPLYNPYVRRKRDGSLVVSPASSRRYADRSLHFCMKITRSDLCYKLFHEHGFTWGGDWRSLKDYQHFEKTQ